MKNVFKGAPEDIAIHHMHLPTYLYSLTHYSVHGEGVGSYAHMVSFCVSVFQGMTKATGLGMSSGHQIHLTPPSTSQEGNQHLACS